MKYNKKIVLSAMIGLLLSGCGDVSASNEDIQQRQKCIQDAVMGTVSDPLNIQLISTASDLITRHYIANKAQEVNYCSTMIMMSRGNSSFDEIIKSCPNELKKMSDKELMAEDSKMQKLASKAADFDNSAFSKMMGRCIQ